MDDIDYIPLKVLPYSAGLIQYKYQTEREDGTPPASNVLLGALSNNIDEVSVVGREVDGRMYFASSMASVHDIKRDLRAFLEMLEDYD